MDFCSFKERKKQKNKQRGGAKLYRIEVDIKTRCDVII